MSRSPRFALLQFLQKTGVLYGFILLLLIGYSSVRLMNLSQAVLRVKSTADTTAYMRISREPVFSSEFLTGSRPFLFPLTLKLFEQNNKKVAWMQGVFSILSWSILAVALSFSVRSFLLRYVTTGLVLLLSLYQYIIGWDSVMLTESLSLSLMGLFIASWLWLIRGWSWYKVFLILAVSTAWAACRDTNAWVLLMIAVFLVLLALPGYVDKRLLVFSAVFVILFFLSDLSAARGNRWVYPFQNVLGRRLLLNPQAVDFLVECGMPVSPALMRMSGEFANGEDNAFYTDPDLENYRAWLYPKGKSCYTRWLLANPLRSLTEPLREFNVLVGMQRIPSFLFSKSFSPVLPIRLQTLLTLNQQFMFVFILATVSALLAFFTKAWKRNPTWWVCIILIITLFPHYFIVWHGDAQGIERHAVSAGIQLYLGMWILILLLLDEILSYLKTDQKLLGTNVE